MRLLGRLLARGLDAGIALLEALGARGSRWEWTKQRWRGALQARLAAWENLERGVRIRMRMCRECRTLVPASESACPSCGASLRGIPTGGPGRLLGMLFPAGGRINVTTALITANVLMTLLVLVTWGTGEGQGLRTLLAPPVQALYAFGAKWTPAIVHGGQIWRLVTANYLHGGILHLALNCLALANLGPLIEDSFGARRFFVIYAVTGIVAFAVSTVASPHAPSVGASGSIFGLVGFAFVYGRFRGGAAGRAVAEAMKPTLFLGVMMFFMPQIDNWAHAGGLAAGAILGLIMSPGRPRGAADAALWVATLAALAVTVVSFAAMAARYAAAAA